MAVVLLLLESGAKATVKSGFEWSALQQAARGGHEEIVKALIENGAGFIDKDMDGWTAIEWAAGNGYAAVCSYY